MFKSNRNIKLTTGKKNNRIPAIIGFDGRCFLDENYTGVQEYAKELLRKISRDYPRSKIKVLVNGWRWRRYQKRIAWLKRIPQVEIVGYNLPNKLLNLSLWLLRWPRLDKLLKGAEVFFAPNIAFLAVSKKAKFILTFHDLSFEYYPETFSYKRRWWHFLVNPRRLAQRADEIWTVSQSTKWDLETIYGIPSTKIKINFILPQLASFFPPISAQGGEELRLKYKLPKKFILYLGTIEPRKNIKNIIGGFERLVNRQPDLKEYHLVISGQWGWNYQGIFDRWQNSAVIDRIKILDFLSFADKIKLYQLAEVFIFPSLFEGFGLPVLEAMAAGTPVVTSNETSLPEVAGETAILINPDKEEELASALAILLQNKEIRQKYVLAGQKKAREWWQHFQAAKINLR